MMSNFLIFSIHNNCHSFSSRWKISNEKPKQANFMNLFDEKNVKWRKKISSESSEMKIHFMSWMKTFSCRSYFSLVAFWCHAVTLMLIAWLFSSTLQFSMIYNRVSKTSDMNINKAWIKQVASILPFHIIEQKTVRSSQWYSSVETKKDTLFLREMFMMIMRRKQKFLSWMKAMKKDEQILRVDYEKIASPNSYFISLHHTTHSKTKFNLHSLVIWAPRSLEELIQIIIR